MAFSLPVSPYLYFYILLIFSDRRQRISPSQESCLPKNRFTKKKRNPVVENNSPFLCNLFSASLSLLLESLFVCLFASFQCPTYICFESTASSSHMALIFPSPLPSLYSYCQYIWKLLTILSMEKPDYWVHQRVHRFLLSLLFANLSIILIRTLRKHLSVFPWKCGYLLPF